MRISAQMKRARASLQLVRALFCKNLHEIILIGKSISCDLEFKIQAHKTLIDHQINLCTNTRARVVNTRMHVLSRVCTFTTHKLTFVPRSSRKFCWWSTSIL